MDIAVLEFFESIRCSFLTVICSVLSFFGEGLFVAACAVVALWLFDDDRIPLTVLFSVALNSFLKVAVARPRPFIAGVVSRVEIDGALVSTMDLKPCESFPSGHSQSLSSLLFSYGLEKKQKKTYLLCGLFCVLVALSRLYLGVHYPTDVLTGLCLGFLSALIVAILSEKFPKVLPYVLFALAILALIPAMCGTAGSYLKYGGLFVGLAASLPFCKYIPRSKASFPKKFLRIPVGGVLAGCVFAFTLFLPAAATIFLYFLIALAALPAARIVFYLLKI
ncbi:MAG: phosphatase PAP2 family protein [Clostridiales bacterium]|nr:phosphatase PAP2 family protein [Clostridiales bacterium]